MPPGQELFSFHLLRLPLTKTPGFLLRPLHEQAVPGLRHAESFFTMKLGEPVTSGPRYDLRKVAVFAWWNDAAALDAFLRQPASAAFADGWHVSLQLYRRWGRVTEIADAVVDAALARPEQSVVAVTLARLKLSQTLRFTRWGKPVERQVRDHPGKTLALAAMRPPGTFCTFSIWKNEAEMINMVIGRDGPRDGESHRVAMQERVRKDFHHEFTTLRFVPLEERGEWEGGSSYTRVG
jgi:hypothetical protein